MATIVYPNSGALWLAGIVQAELASAEIKLFKSGTITLSRETVLADLAAEEADYTGYAAEVITAFSAPYVEASGGATIYSGLAAFAAAAPYTVANSIGGWWIETTGGDLVCAGDFAAPIVVGSAGAGIPFNVGLTFGA